MSGVIALRSPRPLRLPLLALIWAALVGSVVSGAPESDTAAVIDKLLARPAVPHQYRAHRRLEAAGGGQRGWLEADTEFAPGSGMRYEVTAEGGSGYVRSRVLRPLLEQERQLIASGETGRVAINTSNYAFTARGSSEEGLAQVALQPLRKDRALVAGTLFLDPSTADVVRLEGTLAKNPSFWTRRVEVVRSYARVNGTVVPLSLRSVAHLRLFGRSTLEMTYDYSEVDGQPAPPPTSQP